MIIRNIQLAIPFNAPLRLRIVESVLGLKENPRCDKDEEYRRIGIGSVEMENPDKFVNPGIRTRPKPLAALGAEETVVLNVYATVAAEHQTHSLGL
jgi:hypothetical protein